MVKGVLLWSTTAHAQSKRNVEGEELQHSSPTRQTIPSASDPLYPCQRPGSRACDKDSCGLCIAGFCSQSFLLALSCLVFTKDNRLFPAPLHHDPYQPSPPGIRHCIACRDPPHITGPCPICTIKSLFLLCNQSSSSLLSHSFLHSCLHQHAIKLCCCILLCMLSSTRQVKALLVTSPNRALCLLQLSLVRIVPLYIPFVLLMFL
jgi:hypothetical protein